MSIPIPNISSHTNDTTIRWVDKSSANQIIKPSLVLRLATDQNYVMNHRSYLDNYNSSVANAKALCNCGLPGMRLPGVLAWDVTENLDSVIQTAKVDLLNALPVSQISTTLTAALEKRFHTTSVYKHHIKNPATGNVFSLPGSAPTFGVQAVFGPGGSYTEDYILYREFNAENIYLNSLAGFPDPRIPPEEADGSSYWPVGTVDSVGSYFILIDDEVIRVHSSFATGLQIPPGGRAVNGILQRHDAGATVHLLGFGPYTGKWAGMGYLTSNDSRPETSLVRPSSCFVSYEGFNNFASAGNLTKESNYTGANDYEFTGYWFVKDQESSLGPDGIPRISLNLVSAAYLLSQEKITSSTVRKLQSTNNDLAEKVFDEAGHTRHINGDWVGFRSWDPGQLNSYPLKLSVEFAQHKDFFEHMQDTENGAQCELCVEEYRAYVKKNGIHKNPIAEQRAVGKHIYRESIRVYHEESGSFSAGPLRTYGELMIALALASWEIQSINTALAQRWTKVPNQLWTNLKNFEDCTVWNCRPAFKLATSDPTFDWTNPYRDPTDVHLHVEPLLCPFEATYDNQDWFQPLQDLADLNQMTFTFSRKGTPIFLPKGAHLRGFRTIFPFVGVWHLSFNGSIDTYNHNLATDQVYTVVSVEGEDCWSDSAGGGFTIDAGGTHYDENTNEYTWYSAKTGNLEGLVYTGGASQTGSASMDNVILGLGWDTSVAQSSVVVERDGVKREIQKSPEIERGVPQLALHLKKKNKEAAVKRVQLTINFLRQRNYMPAFPNPGGKADDYILTLTVDGDYGPKTKAGVIALAQFLKGETEIPIATRNAVQTDGAYDNKTARALTKWFHENQEYIRSDVWWYALAGLPWEYYLAAMTGLDIPQIKATSGNNDNDSGDSAWMIDQNALKSNISTWRKKHLKDAINYGNSLVNETILKASVKSVTVNIADPRIQLGDIIWLDVPGHLSKENIVGDVKAPFGHGLYVTQISRNMDLSNGTYKATYSGYRARGGKIDAMLKNASHYYGQGASDPS